MAMDLGELAKTINYAWRKLDAWMNRPLPAPRGWFRAALAPEGYPWFVPVLMVLLILGLAIGPTLQNWSGENIGVLLLGLLALAGHNLLAWRRPQVRSWLAAGQILLLALLSLVVWFWAGAYARQADGGLYRHIGLLVAGLLAVALPVDWWVARRLYRSNGSLHAALPQIELFRPGGRYDFRARGIIATLVVVPVLYPVALLLPGSLFTLWHSGGDRLFWWFLGPNLVAAFLLTIGVLFDRIMEMLRTIGRLFFVGPQLVLSIAVVVVAILRLMDVHYINYVFDTGGEANWTVLAYVLLAYAVAWYYAFWSDQFVSRRLIALLGGRQPGQVTPDVIPYPYVGPELTEVDGEGRSIALHGAGRLMVRGRSVPEAAPRFNFHTPLSLLETFQRRLESARTTRTAADPLPVARDLLRSSVAYPVITSVVAFGLILGSAWLSFRYASQPAELSVDLFEPTAFDLKSRLTEIDSRTACGTDADASRPRIALAASGGGTRAALYTASVLRGLAEAGHLCDLVLASGVSGGSAALGYLAANPALLSQTAPHDPQASSAWTSFEDAMAAPYIQSVLDAVGELRVAFAYQEPRVVCHEPPGDRPKLTDEARPARTRLGQLLAESFVCRFGPARIGDTPFGVIFNTALAGHFERAGVAAHEGERTLAQLVARGRGIATDDVAGGRLALTNLPADLLTASSGSVRGMDVVALNGAAIEVGRAAALSANFPPVFPDAAIDVYRERDELDTAERYWVTDGGAVENRATVTLLRALLSAARQICRQRDASGLCIDPSDIPDLHIVVADASAAGVAYRESLGLSSAFGAGGQLGLELEQKMMTELTEVYKKNNAEVFFYDLRMPNVFRRAGIGTHWMLPSEVTFTRPATVNKIDTEPASVVLEVEDIGKIILAMHGVPPASYGDPQSVAILKRWICDDKDSPHHKVWDEITKGPNGKAGSWCEPPA